MSYLLDTNIVSFAIKKNLQITQKLEAIKFRGVPIYISCITYFEIKRGLLAINSPKQTEIFNKIGQDYQIIFLVEFLVLNILFLVHLINTSMKLLMDSKELQHLPY